MALQLRYFASFRERLGCGAETLDGPVPESVADLVTQLSSRGGEWAAVFAGDARVLVAVNEEMAAGLTRLQPGDTVVFFPPVTGG